MKHKIRMLEARPVSPNGIVTMHWPKDSEHMVDDGLLEILIDAGACELVEDKDLKPALETGAPIVTKPKRARKRKAK